MGITPEALRETLAINPDVKAVFVINPSYYGIASDLKAIVEIAHSYDVPVIVDEAHGAHLIFDDRLPFQLWKQVLIHQLVVLINWEAP